MTLVLFHIGDANDGPVSNCSSSVDVAGVVVSSLRGGPGSTVHYATNPYGPWTPVDTPPPGCNNPVRRGPRGPCLSHGSHMCAALQAPFLHPNGTWFLFCSGPLYSAPSFFGPWTVATNVRASGPGVRATCTLVC